MSGVVCCVLLGVKLQISHGCNLKKIFVVQKDVIVLQIGKSIRKKGLFYTFFIAAITVVKFKCAK